MSRMEHLDPIDLLTFVRVVDQGSLSGAARLLGVPRATVTRRLARLEAQSGRSLVTRSTRRMSVTPEGVALHARAAPLLAAWQSLEHDVLHPETEPAGVVRMTAPQESSSGIVPEVIAPLLAAWPALRIDAQFTNRYVDLVGEGFDVAVRAGELPDSGLVARRLLVDALAVYASAAWVEAYGAPATVEALQDRALVLATPAQRGVVLVRGAERRPLSATPRLLVSDFSAAKAAVLAGVGPTVLPLFVAHADVAAGRLVRLLPGWTAGEGVLHLVSPPGRAARPAVRVVMDALASWFRRGQS